MLFGDTFSLAEYVAVRDKVFHDLVGTFDAVGLEIDVYDVRLSFEELCQTLKTLWQNPVVQNKILRGNKAAITENIPLYVTPDRTDSLLLTIIGSYMEHVDQLSAKNYMVSDELFLRAYIRTLGLYRATLKIEEVDCDVFDLSTTRATGKTPMMNTIDFTRLSSVIFVVSLLGYCQPLMEREDKVSSQKPWMWKKLTNQRIAGRKCTNLLNTSAMSSIVIHCRSFHLFYCSITLMLSKQR